MPRCIIEQQAMISPKFIVGKQITLSSNLKVSDEDRGRNMSPCLLYAEKIPKLMLSPKIKVELKNI